MDKADIETLESLAKMMRRNGVQVIEHQGTKILLGPEPGSRTVGSMREVQAAVARAQGLDGVPIGGGSGVIAEMREGGGREPTDEEILFASVRGMPADVVGGTP